MSNLNAAIVSIGQGVSITLATQLSVPGNVELHGEIEGDIECAEIRIGPTGRINGTLTADHIEVQGRVASQVRTETLVLREGSHTSGSVLYETVTIEAGARVDAQLTRSAQGVDAKLDTPATEDVTDVANQ